ncbi:MAG: FtsQ-type POTRA domain-containing protein, partial [Betaproteobacteria bacterium]|nr:FtsQ-type POTRA domain-containing protein [Betaproteobacteria bacterium]
MALACLAATGLLGALGHWIAQKPFFAMQRVIVEAAPGHALNHVQDGSIQLALRRIGFFDFFSLDLESVRDQVQQVDWVRKVQVRRVWPNALLLEVEEHQPIAIWNGAPADTAIPTGNLLSTIRDGGILMVPLIGCSFLLAAFGFERLASLRWNRVVPRLFVARFIEQIQAGSLSRGEAIDACEENGSPAARVFAAAVRRWGRPAVEIEQAALDACEREVNHLRRYRRVFNGIAT